MKGDAKKRTYVANDSNCSNVRVPTVASIAPVGTSSETTKLKGFAVPGVGLTQQGIGRRFPEIILQQRLPKQRNGNKALVGSIAARRVEYLEAVAHGKEDEFTNDNTNSDVLPSISTSNGFSMY